MNQFFPITIENAFIVTPWANLVTRANGYEGMGAQKYTAKLMFPNSSPAYKLILEKQNQLRNNNVLPQSRAFLASLADIPSDRTDYLQEEREIFTKAGQKPENYSIVKITRTQGEHDLYSPSGNIIPKEKKHAHLFSRGHKVNFNGALTVYNKFPLIIIYAIQYVNKGFSDQIQDSVKQVSPFSPIQGVEDPFLSTDYSVSNITDDSYVDSTEEAPF